MPPDRKDIEAGVIARFEDVASDALTKAEGWTIFRGMGAANRIAPSSWNLKSTQQFQFGDLRVELHDRTVVVETESGGGETNLVKYWSIVEELTKPLALIHLFGMMSENDYISHRMLWSFLLEKMRRDFDDAKFKAWIFTYDAKDNSLSDLPLTHFKTCLTAPWGDIG